MIRISLQYSLFIQDAMKYKLFSTYCMTNAIHFLLILGAVNWV